MGADLGLARAQHPRAGGFQVIARRDDVIDLIADVVDATRRVLFQKAIDRAVIAQRMQQFDLGVGQFDKDHGHPVIRFGLRRADLGAKRVAILIRRRIEIRHGDGHMVKTSDHLGCSS